MKFVGAKLGENQSLNNNLPKGLFYSFSILFNRHEMAKKLDYEYCKAAPMLEWLGNKWALVVLVKISENEPVRFNELYRNIPSVS
jgi:hypothetical protein